MRHEAIDIIRQAQEHVFQAVIDVVKPQRHGGYGSPVAIQQLAIVGA
jgi:hypothetical protein